MQKAFSLLRRRIQIRRAGKKMLRKNAKINKALQSPITVLTTKPLLFYNFFVLR